MEGRASQGGLTRRSFLKGGLAGAAALTAAGLPPSVASVLASTAPAGTGSLQDIEYVVILMQENRSFDHYFGTMSSVRGFDDPTALTLRSGRSVFHQPDAVNPDGYLLPFHMPEATTSSPCVADLSHAWAVQHRAWNSGRMDGWLAAHRDADGSDGPLTMGYLTRDDIPFHYALADAFTVCDAYHCSVFGPTHPNRLMAMSATIDPDGKAGGPAIDNNGAGFSWTTYPERLQAAGISWRVWDEGNGDNLMGLFTQYQFFNLAGNPNDYPYYLNGATQYPPGSFEAAAAAGALPTVSWVYGPKDTDEHPSAPPALGEDFVSRCLTALASNPTTWAKTALFLMYDENDGFFDHVAPPTAPPGTPGEYLTVSTLPSTSGGFAGPVGLGFRVPMVVVSPFARGGWLCSDTFDHTSTLRFLETRFGLEVPNLSEWRRSVTGDLTRAFNWNVDTSVPSLPATQPLVLSAAQACAQNPAPGVPAQQSMPAQETTPARLPTSQPSISVPELPLVPMALVGAAVAGLASLRRWREGQTQQPEVATSPAPEPPDPTVTR